MKLCSYDKWPRTKGSAVATFEIRLYLTCIEGSTMKVSAILVVLVTEHCSRSLTFDVVSNDSTRWNVVPSLFGLLGYSFSKIVEVVEAPSRFNTSSSSLLLSKVPGSNFAGSYKLPSPSNPKINNWGMGHTKGQQAGVQYAFLRTRSSKKKNLIIKIIGRRRQESDLWAQEP